MRDQGLAQAWAAVPAPARARLTLASTGWRHLALAGADCLRAARAEQEPDEAARLYALASGVLLWAFGENPLHGPLAAEILGAADLPLPAPARAALSAVAQGWRAPGPGEGGMALFERLAARRDTARLADFLAGQASRNAHSLFWREKALALALYLGDAEPEACAKLEAAALGGLDGGLALVAGLLRGQSAFLRGETELCLRELSTLPPAFGPSFAAARAGLALLAAGEDAAAMPLLFDSLAAAPWQASLAMVAADALQGARQALVPPPGPVLVMLYTWNKAADLDATLSSLMASELCGGRVLVLDNGSSDATPQVLDAWEARAGGTLSRVTLPVNIGAPAARNWLLATEAARAAETLVFLDDDVTLPADWLGRLGAAQARQPLAGVVGCSVADSQAPHLLQNVAGHLAIPPEVEAEPGDARPDLDFQSLTPNPFRLLDAHLQGPDWGLFAHVSPCASVTGCCHLFRRADVLAPAQKGGGFSLALAPSQYDDFERDLRMCAAGGFAVHTGHLRVRHRKRSGLAAQGGGEADGQASLSALGNRYKMQTMHPRAEIAAIISAQAERLGEHIDDTLRRLDAARP
jgi:GT2 family glycosyltransferase